MDKQPLEFESRNLNKQKFDQINQKLLDKDWNGLLTLEDVNVNFDIFCSNLKDIMDATAPQKTFCVFGKRRFVEPWMTTGREESTCKKLRL